MLEEYQPGKQPADAELDQMIADAVRAGEPAVKKPPPEDSRDDENCLVRAFKAVTDAVSGAATAR